MDNVGMSPRARIVERRTYLRPLNEEGTVFETSDQMKDRVIAHQRWLWERQKGSWIEREQTFGNHWTHETQTRTVREFVPGTLSATEEGELAELRDLMDRSLVTMSGRVKWMGGTELVKARSSAAFNCSFTLVENPADLVDVFWLLLQGCGVGFKPVPGLLEGFNPALTQIEVVESTRTEKGGEEDTTEFYDPTTRTWRLTIGDSAKAWAKALGKLLAGKYPATTIILDFSELRPAGKRLKGYGWLSSGWKPLEKALVRICELLIEASGRTLTAIEIGDIVNHLGTVLSSRRSAQIWLHDVGAEHEDWFINAKVGRYENGNEHREQSNNSLLFWKKPTRSRIVELLTTILEGGEPGFINAAEAKRRAPDFHGSNPCAEILLPSKGFCNLVQVVWHRFNGNIQGLMRAQYIAGRANYRQTCVEMKDGVLQLAWDNNQHLLRLCGVAPLGYVSWEGMGNRYMLEAVRDAAIEGANSMADEFGTPRSRRVTQVQPGGCRPWYALTTTDRGLLTMQEMFAERSTDDAWENYSGKASVLQDGKFVPIKSTFVNGVKPVYRVNLNYGLTLDCTSNHPWFVKTRLSASGRSARSVEVNEWVETKDLTERDILEVQIGAYTNTDHAPFTSVPRLAVDLSMASTEIKQPTMMNEDLGWLFGYLWGDGCLSPSKFRLRFIDQHLDILEKAKRIVREQFGIEGAITKCSDKNAHRLEIASRHLWFWLHRNGVHKYLADKIDVLPQIVRSSSRSDILAFIAGLIDSDGAVVGRKDGKKRFVITTADQFFSQHLQHVSWAVGIAFGASHQAMGTSYQNRKSLYSLTASAHCNPDAVRELMSHSIKMTRNYSAMEFACLAADPKKRTLIGRVRSVDEIGEMETYDIEVDGEPWYLNGVVKSHNTSSKHLGLDGDEVHEGAHLALSRWIFNNINVSKGEPLLDALVAANYRVKDHPFDKTAMLVTIPVEYPASPLFTRKTMVIDGTVEVVEVNEESAVGQLERYRCLMEHYVQHNCSITVSFDEGEIEEMADWFMQNWDSYVGVSFLKRNDPTKTAADLGFAYLPQEAVSKRMYDEYVSTLLPLDLSTDDSGEMLDMGDCSTGACPIR